MSFSKYWIKGLNVNEANKVWMRQRSRHSYKAFFVKPTFSRNMIDSNKKLDYVKAPVTPIGDATVFVQRSKKLLARCGVAVKYTLKHQFCQLVCTQRPPACPVTQNPAFFTQKTQPACNFFNLRACKNAHFS